MSTGAFAGAALPGAGGGMPGQHNATLIPQDRLVRKEVALGIVREIVPPQNHIGLSLIAPFMDVATDDVIFGYAQGLVDGLSPARAEDAESELSQKDDTFITEGRASVIDWAIKDHYTASDVNRSRDWRDILELVRDTQNVPLTVQSGIDGWQQKLARDTALRRRKLDNRMEWLIVNQALGTGKIAYNDGRIKFTVDYGRPTTFTVDLTTANGTPVSIADPTGQGNTPLSFGAHGWLNKSGDPIGDLLNIQNFFYDVYGVRLTRAIASRKFLSGLWASDKFIARTGLITATGSTPVDPKYLIDGWSPQAAQTLIENATQIKFIEYDSVYRTRAIGSQNVVNNRFLPANRVILLPDEADINEFDDTGLGFGKTLTSPHPAGNWTSGYYEWEKDYGQDPWGYDVGTGIKAFPVFLHMDKTMAIDFDLTGAA